MDTTETATNDAPSTNETTSREAKLEKTKSREMLENARSNVEDEHLRELAFARFIVKCPCLLCWISLIVIIIFTIVFGALFELTLTNSRTGFPDPPDQYVNDFDGYSLAAEYVEFEEEEETNSITQSEETPLLQYIMVFELNQYKNDLDVENADNTDYWLLTPSNIEKIIKYEDKIYKDQEWKDRFCWVGNEPFDTNYTCKWSKPINPLETEDAIISPARMIADFYNYEYDAFTTEDAKNFTLNFLLPKSSQDGPRYSFCFNPGAADTEQIWIYRSFFKVGTPVGNGKFEWENNTKIHSTDYKNAEDRLQDFSGQSGDYYLWGFPLYEEIIINHDANLVDGDLSVLVYSPSIHGNYLFTALGNSVVFLILAILVVWGYMTYHLQSIFLSSGAMFGILMSFPSAFFVYRVIFQIPIFDVLSTLIVFVLLGVGADDVFVFTDAWSQSALFINTDSTDIDEEQKNIKRMSFTYRRAAMAMLVTQITTFFAFLATALSILVNMSAFGIWSACVVMMNYFIVITLYPAILMIHHKYVKKYETRYLCCCCNGCCKGNKKKSEVEEKPSPKLKPQLSRQTSVLEAAEEYGKIEKFLGTKWSVWMIRYKYFILLAFLIFTILAAIGASNIKTATSTDNAFQDSHWFVRTTDFLQKFSASETDSLIPAHITFGIDGVDRDGVRKYRPDDYYGKVIWDKNFKISSIEEQQYLKFICESLKNQTHLIYSANNVLCPIEDFETYLSEETGYNFPYEYNGTDMSQSEAFNKEWAKFLESSYGLKSMIEALSYNEHNTDTDTYDIKYYAMWFYTSLVSENQFQIDGAAFEAYLDELEIFINDVTRTCPDNLCDSIGNPNLIWVFLSIIKGYISSAVKGILLALPLAFIVMLLSTQNWIIAIFALFDIIGVMLSELAIMFVLGYEFSLTESIATVVIIGFSVDYVVHLANAYLESAAKTRNERLSFALLTIGISIVSGAITTFLAGMFLVFAEFIFFKKMGAILMTTVLMSIIWAMCFFTALCAAIGPQGESGDLKKYFKIIWNKCKSSKNNDDNGDNKKQMEMAIR